MPETTMIFIALAAIMGSVLSINVVFRRRTTNVLIGDGNDGELQRRIRAHGNFIEHVPLALLALAAAESTGAAPATIWVLGLLLLAGRVAHAISILEGKLWPRPVGMALTHASTFIAAGLTLWALLG